MKLTFHGRVRSFGYDYAKDKNGNAKPDEPMAMNYWTIQFEAPEDEFIDLGPPNDPLLEKRPHAVLYVYNMTVPDIEKTKLYGNAKISIQFEE